MIEQLKKDNGKSTDRFPYHTVVYVIYLFNTRRRELRRNDNRLAVVKSTRRITLLPNLVTEVGGYHDKELPYQSTASLPQSTVQAPDYRDGDVEQAFRPYRFRNDWPVPVKLSKTTTRTLIIPSGGVSCEIQPVTIEHCSQHFLKSLRSQPVKRDWHHSDQSEE